MKKIGKSIKSPDKLWALLFTISLVMISADCQNLLTQILWSGAWLGIFILSGKKIVETNQDDK